MSPIPCRIFITCLMFIILLPSSPFAATGTASENYFDKNTDYDIFFHSSESVTSVIEDVQILGFQEIADKKFLVVRSRAFKLQERKGLILFDSITAILPHRQFRIKTRQYSLELP